MSTPHTAPGRGPTPSDEVEAGSAIDRRAPVSHASGSEPTSTATAQATPTPTRDGEASLATIDTLRKRRDFLACARARKWVAPGMVVQARERDPGGPRRTSAPGGAVRVGFTCSRKIGNAVRRNRAKRRLRAAARAVLPQRARPGWDYVLIGRPGVTVTRSFPDLLADLETAIERLHRPPRERPGASGRAAG